MNSHGNCNFQTMEPWENDSLNLIEINLILLILKSSVCLCVYTYTKIARLAYKFLTELTQGQLDNSYFIVITRATIF